MLTIPCPGRVTIRSQSGLLSEDTTLIIVWVKELSINSSVETSDVLLTSFSSCRLTGAHSNKATVSNLRCVVIHMSLLIFLCVCVCVRYLFWLWISEENKLHSFHHTYNYNFCLQSSSFKCWTFYHFSKQPSVVWMYHSLRVEKQGTSQTTQSPWTWANACIQWMQKLPSADTWRTTSHPSALVSSLHVWSVKPHQNT